MDIWIEIWGKTMHLVSFEEGPFWLRFLLDGLLKHHLDFKGVVMQLYLHF